MLALVLASGNLPALVDWNNKLRRRPDKSGGLPLLQLAEEHPGRRETQMTANVVLCQHLRRPEKAFGHESSGA